MLLDPSLAHYLQTVRRYPPLGAQEQQQLLKRARGGDRFALDRLVDSHLWVVVEVSRQFSGRGLPLMDLIAEGSVSLIRVCSRHDGEQPLAAAARAEAEKAMRAALTQTAALEEAS